MKVKTVLMVFLVLVLSGGGMVMAHGGGDKVSSTSGNSMAGMDMGENTMKETPPNMKILGIYGAVNAAFIIIGVWNKWYRRKDGSYVSSK